MTTKLMTRCGMGLALVAAAATAGSAPSLASADRAPDRGRCQPAGARAVVAGRHSGVFQTRRGVERGAGGYYGCWYRRGYRIPIGFSALPTHMRLNGRYLAISRGTFYDEGGDPIYAYVAVYDLGKPRRTFKQSAVSGEAGATQSSAPANSREGDPVVALVVTDRGSAAWIAKPAGPGGSYQVLAADGRRPGPSRLLDSGPAVDPDSLRRDVASTVMWTNDGAPRSAVLGP